MNNFEIISENNLDTVSGAAIDLGVVLAVVTFGIYIYNEGGDFVKGWKSVK